MPQFEDGEMRRMDADRKRGLERTARDALVRQGDDYRRRVGPERMDDLRLGLRSLVTAWSRIMGSAMALDVRTVDAMLVLMANLPMRVGMDLLQRPQMTEIQAELSALRLELLDEIAAKAAAAMEANGFSTGGGLPGAEK